MKNFVLLGAPGSGKGTQSYNLVEKFGFIHISTGNIIRNINIKNKKLNILFDNYYNQGKLIPDDIIIKIIENYLHKIIGNLIWDGFPRTIIQAKKFEKLLKKMNSSINHVFYFKIDENKLIKRIIDRLICSFCGRIYNKINLLPKILWICNDDKKALIKRKDDNEEKIKIRLKIYNSITFPLIEYYLNKKKLTVINADMEKDKVWNQIMNILVKKNGGNK